MLAYAVILVLTQPFPVVTVRILGLFMFNSKTDSIVSNSVSASINKRIEAERPIFREWN